MKTAGGEARCEIRCRVVPKEKTKKREEEKKEEEVERKTTTPTKAWDMDEDQSTAHKLNLSIGVQFTEETNAKT